MRYLFIFLSLIIISFDSFAIREARPTPIDSRIRVIVYNPDDVIKFTGYYNYQTSIQFSDNEEISTISMGDTTGWQIVPEGNRMFIKPMEKNADTNMTVITNLKNNITKKHNSISDNQRIYFFELYARETDDIRNPNMVFNIKFLYSDDEDNKTILTQNNNTLCGTGKAAPDLECPEKYNFNYTLSGSEDIAPIKVFDDGEFTYLQFRGKNTEIPAIFAVDEELRESMINYRVVDKNMVVLEQVFKKIALKNGKKVSCIFNEAFNPF